MCAIKKPINEIIHKNVTYDHQRLDCITIYTSSVLYMYMKDSLKTTDAKYSFFKLKTFKIISEYRAYSPKRMNKYSEGLI